MCSATDLVMSWHSGIETDYCPQRGEFGLIVGNPARISSVVCLLMEQGWRIGEFQPINNTATTGKDRSITTAVVNTAAMPSPTTARNRSGKSCLTKGCKWQ